MVKVKLMASEGRRGIDGDMENRCCSEIGEDTESRD